MITFTTLFLVFIYFKIARVHKKEEKLSGRFILMHALVGVSALFLLIDAFSMYEWYTVFVVALLFFIAAALLITVIQLGIFVEGKPLLGMSTVYTYLPLLVGVIVFLTIGMYVS